MKKKIFELASQIFADGGICDDDLEFILNPNKNPVFYKYLKDIGIVHETKYAIKIGKQYVPRLFDSIVSADTFATVDIRKQPKNSREYVFYHICKFEHYNIEKI